MKVYSRKIYNKQLSILMISDTSPQHFFKSKTKTFCVIIPIFFYMSGCISQRLLHKPPKFFYDSEQPNHLLGETCQTIVLSENFITAAVEKKKCNQNFNQVLLGIMFVQRVLPLGSFQNQQQPQYILYFKACIFQTQAWTLNFCFCQ